MNEQDRLEDALSRINDGRDYPTWEPLDRELDGWLEAGLRREGAAAAESFARYLEAA